MCFTSVDLVVRLIDGDALAACARRNSSDPRRLHGTHVVVDSSDAVVVSIADVNFNITPALVIQRRDTAWLVEARFESGLVSQSVLSVSEPGEDLVSERIYHFDLVIVGVCHDDHVLLRDKVDAERVLKFGINSHSICVTVGVEIAGIVVASYQVPCTLERLHIDRTDAGRLGVSNVQLDVAC